MALSKLYTAKIVADLIRGVVKELGEEILQPEEILSYVNLAQQIVYNELPEEEYLVEVALTESNNELSFSDKYVVKPIKLVDSVNGIVNIVGIKEFEELEKSPSKKYKVYATIISEKFKLFKGEEVTGYGNFVLTYIMGLTPCTSEASFLDVKDRYVPKVIDIAKQLVYEQLGKKADK